MRLCNRCCWVVTVKPNVMTQLVRDFLDWRGVPLHSFLSRFFHKEPLNRGDVENRMTRTLCIDCHITALRRPEYSATRGKRVEILSIQLNPNLPLICGRLLEVFHNKTISDGSNG